MLYLYSMVIRMNEKNKCNTFLACSVLVLLVGLYYVIFIYDHNKNLEEIEDIEGSCNITECEEQEEISYILELEKIKTFEDNYLILPIISINDDSKNIQDINKQLEAKFKYYKDMYNKDNTSYLSTYEYNVDIDNNI